MSAPDVGSGCCNGDSCGVDYSEIDYTQLDEVAISRRVGQTVADEKLSAWVPEIQGGGEES